MGLCDQLSRALHPLLYPNTALAPEVQEDYYQRLLTSETLVDRYSTPHQPLAALKAPGSPSHEPEHKHADRPHSAIRMGLGCLGLTPANAYPLIKQAYLHGVRHFDTAALYGSTYGEAECALGQALLKLFEEFPQARTDLVVATKGGVRLTACGLERHGDRHTLHQSIAASLQRLQRKKLDVFYLHRVDPAVPIEDSVAAIAEKVYAGLVDTIGLSEVSLDELKRAHRVHPIAYVQNEYALWSRDSEVEGIVTFCKAQGITFVAYSPLGRAFFTSRTDKAYFDQLPASDLRAALPRYQGKNLDTNLALRRHLEQLAQKKHADVAQISLSWLLAQGDHILPIPGTTDLAHLATNCQAEAITLTLEERARLNIIYPPGCFAGARWDFRLEKPGQHRLGDAAAATPSRVRSSWQHMHEALDLLNGLIHGFERPLPSVAALCSSTNSPSKRTLPSQPTPCRAVRPQRCVRKPTKLGLQTNNNARCHPTACVPIALKWPWPDPACREHPAPRLIRLTDRTGLTASR